MLTSLEDTFSCDALLLGTERVTAQGEPIGELEHHIGLINGCIPLDGLALGFKSSRRIKFRRIESTRRSGRVKPSTLSRRRSRNRDGSRRPGMLSDSEAGSSGVLREFGLADGGSREARSDVCDLRAAGNWQGGGELLGREDRRGDVGGWVRHFCRN
jgi:hypothetical protein